MYKQVIILRKDLKMSKGKAAAQACHAAVHSFEKVKWSLIEKWKFFGSKKVVLAVNNEEEILEIYKQVKKAKIPCFLVKDAGLTELKPGTITALGIGPVEEEKIDKITGSLKPF
ncbi:MAG: peptidyl-tRNA hydrolase Pth2 [Candidatus Aenigmarchaeota archaeon]|nr:peptidyl-tRNA hydrolase Pth2 [Candidatus Aenigmarchaeota archaeon]MBU5688827.1 peptidyl-tRNA hydrolase Pth2 [Candidatus Aenigmarchaeota archaeon]